MPTRSPARSGTSRCTPRSRRACWPRWPRTPPRPRRASSAMLRACCRRRRASSRPAPWPARPSRSRSRASWRRSWPSATPRTLSGRPARPGLSDPSALPADEYEMLFQTVTAMPKDLTRRRLAHKAVLGFSFIVGRQRGRRAPPGWCRQADADRRVPTSGALLARQAFFSSGGRGRMCRAGLSAASRRARGRSDAPDNRYRPHAPDRLIGARPLADDGGACPWSSREVPRLLLACLAPSRFPVRRRHRRSRRHGILKQRERSRHGVPSSGWASPPSWASSRSSRSAFSPCGSSWARSSRSSRACSAPTSSCSWSCSSSSPWPASWACAPFS